MTGLNYYYLLVSALIPLFVGGLWYSPKLFANVWMRENNLTEKDLQGANMIKIFGLTYVFSLFISLTIMMTVIHQWGVYSSVDGDTSPETVAMLEQFMAKYGNNFRSFKHGMLHGGMMGLFVYLPVIGIIGLFERKSWTYIFIHVGFWTVSSILMGGFLCAML